MKRFRLLVLMVLAFATNSEVLAQYGGGNRRGGPITELRGESTSKPHSSQLIIISDGGLEEDIYLDFEQTRAAGFQQLHNPQIIFSTRSGRFSLGIGGEINMRTSYDFKGAVDDIDFVTYDIPMDATYANRQRVMMDASASRLYFKALVNSPMLGRVVAFVDMDFRGGEEFSYIPHLRSAYISAMGFTAGRDVTTFCDLEAVPEMIDHQGPNAYNYSYATMIRYERSFYDNHFTVGVAAEMPVVRGTYGEFFHPLAQRVPDIPLYVQYSWGDERQSHVRASAVLRNMYLHNALTAENTSLFGWGIQASAHYEINEFVTLYANAIYGEGITQYIQDLAGSGLDFTPDPENAKHIQTMPMWAWQASARLSLLPDKMWFSGGYSTVKVNRHNGFYGDDQYRRGTYIFANTFCQITPNLRIGAEYLHGSRKNRSGAMGEANRLSLLVQYNF